MLCNSGTNGGTVPIHDVNDTRREAGLIDKLANAKCSERGELRRLQNDGVSRSESRSELPRKHEDYRVSVKYHYPKEDHSRGKFHGMMHPTAVGILRQR
jgi:hypothetical protein